MRDGVPAAKRASHGLKAAWYRAAWVDDVVDRILDPRGDGSDGPAWLRERGLYRLFPERRLRASPFEAPGPPADRLARILTLIPPEDTGGGSRPAQIAVELLRRGFAIEWRWALPIFPWPRRRRPAVAGVDARHVDEPGADRAGPADLVLLEAPHPRLAAMAAATRGPMVYDAIDEWSGSLGAGWYDRATETRLLRDADHLVASAALLRDDLAQRSGRRVELLPNAVDPALFDARGARAAPIVRGEPTVVYVGALWGEWVDVALIADLARARPRAEIHLIGPPGSRTLPDAPNVHVHGARPRAEIPGFLAAADVTIVPFVSSRLSAAVSPLKVFEYLAMGRPVVSTGLPDLRGVPGVTVSPDAASFLAAVDRASREPFPHDTVRRFLADQTWARRVDRLLDLTRAVR